MGSARRGAASGSCPYTFDDLRRAVQNTNNWLDHDARDAPRHALEEPTNTALLGPSHRLQEHAGDALANTSYHTLRTARGGRSHILALGGPSSSVALLRVGRVARE